MRKSLLFRGIVLMFALSFLILGAFSQQPEKKPAPQTASARLTSAKNVMVTRDRGSNIPYDTIKTTLDGWERFTLVDKAEKADLLITVATTGGDSNFEVASSGGLSPLTGHPEQSTRTGREFSNAEITMTVYDAKNKKLLWVATDTAKSALKQTTRENNLVEAAERLAAKFHDRLEPPPPKEKD